MYHFVSSQELGKKSWSGYLDTKKTISLRINAWDWDDITMGWNQGLAELFLIVFHFFIAWKHSIIEKPGSIHLRNVVREMSKDSDHTECSSNLSFMEIIADGTTEMMPDDVSDNFHSSFKLKCISCLLMIFERFLRPPFTIGLFNYIRKTDQIKTSRNYTGFRMYDL